MRLSPGASWSAVEKLESVVVITSADLVFQKIIRAKLEGLKFIDDVYTRGYNGNEANDDKYES